MSFLSFIVLLAIGYLLWRVTDQLPDLIFRLSEIQRDIADIRRRMTESDSGSGAPQASQTASSPSSAPQASQTASSPSSAPQASQAASQQMSSGAAPSSAGASSAPVTGGPASGGSSTP